MAAEFDSVSLQADAETELSADRLAELKAASMKRCRYIDAMGFLKVAAACRLSLTASCCERTRIGAER